MGGKTRESALSEPEPEEPDTRTAPEPGDANKETKLVDSGKDAQPYGTERAAGTPSRLRRADRAGLAVIGAALAACGGLVLYGVLDTGQGGGGPQHRTPTAAVTYEVTGQGTADITYQARSEAGKATVVRAARLPWRTSVEVPLGRDPIVSIVLGDQGGQARCTLAVRGHHVQSATATGTFGRATCAGPLPSPDTTTR
ncbi:hypothetical protein [Streptomyces sp. NPDC050287]|uniref:hypothetical protein n=1 Tax=Streptomyces sp. NPDC050287 TaxID=3365608 RepID=UPI00379B5F9A